MSKERQNLNKFTKEELIFIIDQMRAGDTFGRFERALINLEHRQRMSKLDEADQHAKKADEARKRYIELLRPYQGKPWADIKLEVLQEARAALDEAQREEKLYLQKSKEAEK